MLQIAPPWWLLANCAEQRNSRTHSKKQIRQLADVILRFGWTYPILADENSRSFVDTLVGKQPPSFALKKSR